MDGPSSSGVPSTSLSSATNPGPGTLFSSAPRQSPREIFSSVPSTPATAIDPPRPAKEGYEWVWFPAGYWAEREIVEAPSKDSTKAFRWRKRSGKSSSGSPKNYPLANKTEVSLDNSTGGRPPTRTAASSESGGFAFPLNRAPDAPLPSPYLTEEAHVQSLQWPSIDAAARRSSTSESSMFKSRVALSPSPLHLSRAGDEPELDRISPSTARGQAATSASSDTINTELLTPRAAVGREPKAKKSFIVWRMLSENRQRLKRSQASSDEHMGGDMIHIQSSRPQGATASPLRKASNISDKSHKSLKGLSTKLFRKARWHRKISNSSAASTSSSLQTSVRSYSPNPTPVSDRGEGTTMANVWASDYPGGEAIRVQTPSIDRIPRCFFSDLALPSTPRRPLSRQEGPINLQKTNLSTSFTPGDANASPMPSLPEVTRNGYYNDNDRSAIKVCSNKLGMPGNDGRMPSPRRSRKDNGPKEWWEVSVPTSYRAVDQRTFKFDLPEHLPTSPMCPANKRHKSGGTGVCVYHGRAKGRMTSAVSDGDSPNLKDGEDEEKANGCVDREQETHDEDSGEGSDVWK
ncbi:hypothetical protein F4824DRAFT_72489 [Ustulina deusta]|nr:hypothetical protein F4824DRAFT_72489 [Ustulina deusta]